MPPEALAEAVGQKLLLAFKGFDRPPEGALAAIQAYRPAGFTLFRAFNLGQPAQVRELTDALQRAAREHGLPPFLLAVDQEGGQLSALGAGAAPLPGNMALGAAGSRELARQAGEVLGRELAAMGLNVDYAPCCDVNSNPENPVIGIRSFGEDPGQAADLAAAMIEGIQSCGVAATAKHFPGHGDTRGDSHHGLPVVEHSLERLEQVALPPFAAAVRAGVKLVMTGHLALPAIDGRRDLPATFSAAAVQGLLRERLGYAGVVVSDAMDMQAVRQGEGPGGGAVRAAAAGVDLLLLTSEPADQREAHTALLEAARRGPGANPGLDPQELARSAGRVQALKRWLAAQPAPPELDAVGCRAHLDIADEIAARSVTLVRDHARLLPLRPGADDRLAVVLPQPRDLTPADTSSYVRHSLPEALRDCGAAVDEYILPAPLEDLDLNALVDRLRDRRPRYRAVVYGTLNAVADPAQAALARRLLEQEVPTVFAALRLPYDLLAFPAAPTYLCTYSLLEPSMRALARVLCGQAAPRGRLPVSLPGLYPRGHGVTS